MNILNALFTLVQTYYVEFYHRNNKVRKKKQSCRINASGIVDKSEKLS